MTREMVLVEQHDLIGIITINNPKKKNAVNEDILKTIIKELHSMEEQGIRVIILTAQGNNIFCSGYDITASLPDYANMSLEQAMEEMERTDYVKQITRTIEKIGVPVIAMIKGHCIGAGLDIVAACDFRYATSNVKFSIPPAKLGIVYNPEGIRRLINILGVPRAKELLFLGKSISAKEALKYGLVHEILPDTKSLEDYTMVIANTLVQNAPLAVRGMKKIFRYFVEEQELSREKNIEAARLILKAINSEDIEEAKKAFLEKRKPNFKGK
ncbi:enoyl-CoA hydratase [Desulfothermus naphthae]